MTFLERYSQEPTWHGKAMIMEIYHLAMSHADKDWTISKTSQNFGCSIGLVSENLRLAIAIHYNPNILKIPTRQEALRRIRIETGNSNGKEGPWVCNSCPNG